MVIGTTLNQRFLLDKELGRGGMGAVYRATDQVLQRTVAIKVLKEITGEEVGRRLRLEAQILARLLHDNIVRLYDFGLDNTTYYFVMEEVDGTSFSKRWKKIDLADRVRILSQVAEALDYAHHQGVVHRDVKPANVLLSASDQAKLSDFGLSLLIDSEQESNVVRGTPHYMSPEQARGKRLDHRTDLYALGVMLYECATGSPPFQGPVMTIMSHHVTAVAEPPRARNPEISEDFERLITRLMAKNPEDRPSSGREVAGMLRAMYQEGRLIVPDRSTPAATETEAFSGVVVAADSPSRSSAISSNGHGPTGMIGTVSSGTGSSVIEGEESRLLSRPSSVPVPSGSITRLGGAAARDMIERIEAEPIQLNADERYLCGHYLGYLLGGSRRRGFLRRRPLDPLNADRARLLLAMTYLMIGGAEGADVKRAARLLDERSDVRPALSPIVVMKYLASRDNPKKRKQFRQVRRQLGEASAYASKHMTDDQGVLNPGLMPQALDDLRRLAPERLEVDDQLVQRWNRVTEVWRWNAEFRESVLRYATRRAFLDPASLDLWPEVVYPLIERARWQRRLRSRAEVVWDKVAENLHIPDAGVRMDLAFNKAVPEQVVANLEVELGSFEEDPSLSEPARPPAESAGRMAVETGFRPESFQDIDIDDQPTRDLVRLNPAGPSRHTLGELRELWREAIAALKAPTGARPARTVSIGPYRLAVVASIRARSAGQVALQGMTNKQIEILLPSFTGGGSASKPVLAVWLYQNNSLAITHIDNRNLQRYICWDTVAGAQHNFDHPEDLNHELLQLGLEAPDGLDRVLTKRYQPRNPA